MNRKDLSKKYSYIENYDKFIEFLWTYCGDDYNIYNNKSMIEYIFDLFENNDGRLVFAILYMNPKTRGYNPYIKTVIFEVFETKLPNGVYSWNKKDRICLFFIKKEKENDKN